MSSYRDGCDFGFRFMSYFVCLMKSLAVVRLSRDLARGSEIGIARLIPVRMYIYFGRFNGVPGSSSTFVQH